MRILTISVHNFLRLRRLMLDLTAGKLHLIAGRNEAGKSSLQEALRFCLLGETLRVDKKKEYPLMVTDGAKKGVVKVTTDRGAWSRDVATGKCEPAEPDVPHALAYLLDATRYTWVDPKARRTFMFGLLGITVSRQVIEERLRERGVPQEKIDYILPLLRGGFEAAASEAAKKATEARGAWGQLTGERYGSSKAEAWQPTKRTIDAARLLEAEKAVKAATKRYDEAQQALGAAKAYPQGTRFECPSCHSMLVLDRGEIRVTSEEELAASPAALRSERQELERNASQAAAAVEAARNDLKDLEAQIHINDHADEIAEQAGALHEQVAAWAKLQEALAPDGIPGEIIADKIKPLNDRLRATAQLTGWKQVSVNATLDIFIDGRPYALESESSKWRAQATIAEAISKLSGLGFLVLDRIDVLDPPRRPSLLKWLIKVAPEHNTILAIGTMKERPSAPGVTVHWLVEGEEAPA